MVSVTSSVCLLEWNSLGFYVELYSKMSPYILWEKKNKVKSRTLMCSSQCSSEGIFKGSMLNPKTKGFLQGEIHSTGPLMVYVEPYNEV